MLKKLRDIWDVESEIALAWQIIAQEGGLDEDLEPIETLADALEQITIADMLEMYPHGFAVGPMAGLYAVVRVSGYNEQTDFGTLVVQKLFRQVGD